VFLLPKKITDNCLCVNFKLPQLNIW